MQSARVEDEPQLTQLHDTNKDINSAPLLWTGHVSKSELCLVALVLSYAPPISRRSMRLSSESPTVVASDSSLIHRNTAAASSAPSTMHLTFPGVASMFVKMRRASSQAKVNAQGKPNHIESCSGLEPVTDPSLSGENATLSRKLPMTQTDVYTCIGGVNILVLLRATRSALIERAETLGANVLVDESWKCTICNNRSNGTYKVNIRYQASATRSSVPDPHKPVALDNAKGVPGLMTIIKRND